MAHLRISLTAGLREYSDFLFHHLACQMKAGNDSTLISACVVELTGLLGPFHYQSAANLPQSVGRFIQYLHSAIVTSAHNQRSGAKFKNRGEVLHTELMPTSPPPIALDMVAEDDDIVLVFSAIDYDAAESVAVYSHVDTLIASQDKEFVSWLISCSRGLLAHPNPVDARGA